MAPEIVDSRTPPALASIVMKCLVKSPDDRFQRGVDLADAPIGFLAQNTSPSATRRSWLARRAGSEPVPAA